MIFDNAGYHEKKDLGPFFADNRHRLRPLSLPPYSPNLNPIERVWRMTRRQVTHNRYFESLNQLVDSMECFVNFLKRANIILRSLWAIT
jgi:transposase